MGYICYEMEELLPIVAELADKYTSKESTSVSYEKANQLMEAVLYCIHQCEDREGLLSKRGLPAREAYRLGCERLLKKVKKVQEAYNEMVVDFCAYGNENCQDTVTEGIYAFFRYYDALFAPQETIITMDYPTIRPIIGSSGIDAIESYVKAISLEQQFLHAIPQETVYRILQQYQTDYHKQFYNICSIVLRHILVCPRCLRSWWKADMGMTVHYLPIWISIWTSLHFICLNMAKKVEFYFRGKATMKAVNRK